MGADCHCKPLPVACNAAVCVAAVAAAAVSDAAAAAARRLPLLVRARVRPGSVQNGVHVSTPKMGMCTAACAGLGSHASVRAAGAGEWVRGGLAEPPSPHRALR